MSRTALLPPITEQAFQRQVIALARLHHWRVAHFRPARTAKGWRTPCQADAAGWPDLVLCRPPRLLFVELKSERGRLSAEQEAWIDALTRAGQVCLLWRPSDWEEIERVLSGSARHG